MIISSAAEPLVELVELVPQVDRDGGSGRPSATGGRLVWRAN